jgi:hypothetical protein
MAKFNPTMLQSLGFLTDITFATGFLFILSRN